MSPEASGQMGGNEFRMRLALQSFRSHTCARYVGNCADTFGECGTDSERTVRCEFQVHHAASLTDANLLLKTVVARCAGPLEGSAHGAPWPTAAATAITALFFRYSVQTNDQELWL